MRTSLDRLVRTIDAAGWPTQMSRPFAAKSVGACLKHVLNTRLSSESLDVGATRYDMQNVLSGCAGGWVRSTSIHPRASGLKLLRSIADGSDAVRDADPLPPENRAAVPARKFLDDLYRRQAPRLLRMFLRRAGNDDADDLLQEAFMRYAARGIHSVDHIVEPEAYLSRVATNLLRDRAKFAVRRAAVYHQEFDDESIGGSSPVDQLENRDALRRLDAAVQRLKPRPRQIFLLQRVDGMTYAQIAERTGMSVKAVKKQMAKALYELRRDLGPN